MRNTDRRIVGDYFQWNKIACIRIQKAKYVMDKVWSKYISACYPLTRTWEVHQKHATWETFSFARLSKPYDLRHDCPDFRHDFAKLEFAKRIDRSQTRKKVQTFRMFVEKKNQNKGNGDRVSNFSQFQTLRDTAEILECLSTVALKLCICLCKNLFSTTFLHVTLN